MKRVLGAVFIASVLFYLSFISSDYLCDSCEEMKTKLEICAEKIKTEDYESALTITYDLQGKWQENITLLSIISGDDNLLSPGKNIPAIHDSVRDENYESALMLIRECQGYFEEIIESQKLSLGNIL